jgi:carbon-monoxide dehydrogenase large subunit
MRWAGTLMVQACAELRARSRALAAAQLEAAEADLVYSAGTWSVAGTDRQVSLFSLAPVHAEATFTGRIPAHPTGCAVCEVEVSPSTGRVVVVRYTAVDDAGQPINPLILEGQIAGGIAQGVGQALLEHMAYEGDTAQPVTASFLDYAIPRATLLPPLTLELAEDPTTGNPLRVKGGGEAGITPALAAVANAVVDALSPIGVTHIDMPLTPARVWEALPG